MCKAQLGRGYCIQKRGRLEWITDWPSETALVIETGTLASRTTGELVKLDCTVRRDNFRRSRQDFLALPTNSGEMSIVVYAKQSRRVPIRDGAAARDQRRRRRAERRGDDAVVPVLRDVDRPGVPLRKGREGPRSLVGRGHASIRKEMLSEVTNRFLLTQLIPAR